MAERRQRTEVDRESRTARRSASRPNQGTDKGLRNDVDGGSGARRASSRRTQAALPAEEAAKSALEQFSVLIGKSPLAVTSVDRSEDGWVVEVEVVEIERIPSSSDMLALYEVELDPEGELLAYRRTRRYSRASVINGTQ